MLLSEVARLVDGVVEGDGTLEIDGAGPIENARGGQITFLSDTRYRQHAATTSASAILTRAGDDVAGLGLRGGMAVVRVGNPYNAFVTIAAALHPAPPLAAPGIDARAIVSPAATIAKGVSIGPGAVVGPGASVGEGTSIGAGAVIGEGTSVGARCAIHENVVVKFGCRIGNDVVIHPGTVIGSDGFGFARRDDGSYGKIPQTGTVVVEDDVEIGANCTIDRAMTGETRICRGAKLDNLIMIAHNVVIGEHTVIAAQTGIAGSTRIGRECLMGGQVGIVGHISIADRTMIGAQSGIARPIEQVGQTWFGSPARVLRQSLRIEAALRQLPDLLAELQKKKPPSP